MYPLPPKSKAGQIGLYRAAPPPPIGGRTVARIGKPSV
jgi:hypothetical protein